MEKDKTNILRMVQVIKIKIAIKLRAKDKQSSQKILLNPELFN